MEEVLRGRRGGRDKAAEGGGEVMTGGVGRGVVAQGRDCRGGGGMEEVGSRE